MYGAGLVVAWAVMGALGYAMGQRKNRTIEGLLLGLLLGLIGLVILACLKPKEAVPSAQSWPVATSYGAPAANPFAEQSSFGQASFGYGQAATVLPAAMSTATNPYAPVAETPGHGYGQPAPIPAAMVPAPVPAQWYADPSGRHQHRWWDGTNWTEHVADNGVASLDAPLPAQPF